MRRKMKFTKPLIVEIMHFPPGEIKDHKEALFYDTIAEMMLTAASHV